MKKTTFAALLAASTLTFAASAWAVDAVPAKPEATPTVPPITAEAEAPTPMVGMSDAVATAEKEYKAKTHRANLRRSATYGLVWDVHMVREDDARVRAFVDAKTGKIVAADVKGIQEPRGPKGPRAGEGPRRGMGPGMGPGYGYHHGGAQCPVTGEPRPYHGRGHHAFGWCW